MRWPQRLGYGGVGPLPYGVSAPPGFWGFLISNPLPGGDLHLCNGDHHEFTILSY